MAPSSPASSDSSGLSSAPPTPPQTPGRPTTPGRRDADSQSVEPSAEKAAESSARSRQRGARSKRGSEAQAAPQTKAKRGGAAGVKGDTSSTPAPASEEAAAPWPQKKLTVKLTRKGKGKNGTPGASSASPSLDAAQPLPPASSASVQPPSSDFRAQLKDLADSEDEDGGNVVRPKKRRGGGAAIADDDEEDEEQDEPASTSASRTSIVLKRKRNQASSDSQRRDPSKKFKKRTLSQPERPTDSDEDFVGQGDDSDDVMSDVGSEESASGGEAYAEKASGLVDGDEDFAPAKSQKKQGGARAAGKGAKKSKAGESSTATTRPPPHKKGDGSAGVSSSGASKTAGLRKGSSKQEPKTVPSTIRASAAATSTSTTSSPAGTRPLAAGQAGAATQKRPPQLNKPKATLSMWDSLVGSSSKPAAPAQPPKPAHAAAASKGKEEQKVGGDKEGDKAKEQSGPRATPAGGPQAPGGSSTSTLPRPLGINRPQGLQSSSSTPQPGSTHGHGHGHGHHGNFRDSTISIHVTPGLNGQHWDKAAYRSLRVADKERYRLPPAEGLLDLLEDTEVIVSFEEEWRAKRIRAGAGGQTRYASSKATQYGAGRDYAKGTVRELLKGRRRAPAADAVAVAANGSAEGGEAQPGEESKQLTA